MLSKKVLCPSSDDLIREELKLLYVRRSTVDSLIRSLEAYARYNLTIVQAHKEKTA